MAMALSPIMIVLRVLVPDDQIDPHTKENSTFDLQFTHINYVREQIFNKYIYRVTLIR